jgi:hypothetical protein
MPEVSDAAARVILAFYKRLNLRDRQSLMLAGLEYSFVTQRHGTVEEFRSGIEHAIQCGWIEVQGGRVFLTASGYTAAQTN